MDVSQYLTLENKVTTKVIYFNQVKCINKIRATVLTHPISHRGCRVYVYVILYANSSYTEKALQISLVSTQFLYEKILFLFIWN